MQGGSRVSGGGEGANSLTPLVSAGVASDDEDECRGYLHQIYHSVLICVVLSPLALFGP